MKRITETTVGAFDAKTNLGRLLDRVENGETIVITRHGVPVARLTPYKVEIDREKVRKAVRELKDLSKGQSLPPGMTIRDLIDEGRRF
jgi:prevent-host-death family protein